MKNFTKKYLIVPLVLSIIFSFLFISPVNAAFTGRTEGACNGPFGLISWDCNVNISDENSIKSGIWQIVANIGNDISIFAAYLILGYVIYAGYLYTFSTGDPGKVATAKKTLLQAFIGLAIVLSANLIMSTIRIALIGGSGSLASCASGSCIDAGTMAVNAINWFITIAGVVSTIFVIYGGIAYITSNGDPNKAGKARSIIMYALIGLIIVALSGTITSFVSSAIRNANQGAILIQIKGGL